MSKIVEISDANFEQEVMLSQTPVLVDFWAPWCAPCKAIAPILDEVATHYGDKLKIVKVNIDYHKEAAAKYNVRAIPTLIVFKNGAFQDQFSGLMAKQTLIDAVDKIV